MRVSGRTRGVHWYTPYARMTKKTTKPYKNGLQRVASGRPLSEHIRRWCVRAFFSLPVLFNYIFFLSGTVLETLGCTERIDFVAEHEGDLGFGLDPGIMESRVLGMGGQVWRGLVKSEALLPNGATSSVWTRIRHTQNNRQSIQQFALGGIEW